MAPEISYNSKRVKLEVRDVIQIVIYIVVIVGAFYATKLQVAEVAAWGNPPAGRLYILERDVERHHNVTEASQQAKIDADHDKVLSLEGKIETLTKEIQQNNRLLEQLLRKK